jgi:RHS repeat-associated protein
MPGRIFQGQYRFGFNGQEKDDEVMGSGNTISFEYRMEDSRLGRFLSVDPLFKKFTELSTYQYASNSPVLGKDVEGLENLFWFIRYSGFDPYADDKSQKQQMENLTEGLKKDFTTKEGLKKTAAGTIQMTTPVLQGIVLLGMGELLTGGLGSGTAAEEFFANASKNGLRTFEETSSGTSSSLYTGMRPCDPVPVAPVQSVGNINRTVLDNGLQYDIAGVERPQYVSFKNGNLSFDLNTGGVKGAGSHILEDAINYYGDKVKSVSAIWGMDPAYPNSVSRGLQEFNVAYDSYIGLGGNAEVNAANSTTLGSKLRKEGFTNTTVHVADRDQVEVTFSKPDK